MNKFKDTGGRWFTVGIFKELSGNPDTVLFTIEEAKALYMECNDITGYDFATTHIGGWQHWLTLFSSPKVEPLIREWEEELEVKMRSVALRQIETLSKGDKGYQAAKFITDGQWRKKTTGRPSKESINKEARIQNKMYDEFNVVEFKK